MKTFPAYNTPGWEQMTMSDHAEAWYQEQGNTIPKPRTEAWLTMYQDWINFAFAGFSSG